jgi:hypothetical protein
MTKYVILSCGIKKRYGGEKGTEYMTPISYSCYGLGTNLTWLDFEF